jgi:hypothetical protein
VPQQLDQPQPPIASYKDTRYTQQLTFYRRLAHKCAGIRKERANKGTPAQIFTSLFGMGVFETLTADEDTTTAAIIQYIFQFYGLLSAEPGTGKGSSGAGTFARQTNDPFGSAGASQHQQQDHGIDFDQRSPV